MTWHGILTDGQTVTEWIPHGHKDFEATQKARTKWCDDLI